MNLNNSQVDRRSLLSWSGAAFGLLIMMGGAGFAAMIRFLFPNVVYEPSKQFKIGFQKDFPMGAPTFFPDQKIFVFRDPTKGFSVASAVCTHLGCTVRWDAANNHFACPCHGSIFSEAGQVLAGPAPRPLEWMEVTLAKDNQLQVDQDHLVPPTYHLLV